MTLVSNPGRGNKEEWSVCSLDIIGGDGAIFRLDSDPLARRRGDRGEREGGAAHTYILYTGK